MTTPIPGIDSSRAAFSSSRNCNVDVMDLLIEISVMFVQSVQKLSQPRRQLIDGQSIG
ncbi:hypothetical protein [Burkholderia ubonensis]|uniref:hypothetical protein n=1 Tax=Burkholderia ubonensis TaxID=101571 RepID=UPI0012FB6702|nr:hypothetical protein [Burkholderia ubonensis]